MKTKIEIAKQTIDKYIKVPVETISTKEETMYVSNAIQACVDSIIKSQEWILIEDELPECKIEDEGIFYSEYILVKIKGYEHPYVAFYVKANDDEFFDLIHLEFDKYIKQEDITHWRPIELN